MIRLIAFTLFLLVVVSNVFEADALPSVAEEVTYAAKTAEGKVSKLFRGYIVDPLKKVAEKTLEGVFRVAFGAVDLGVKGVKRLVGEGPSPGRGRNMVLSS